MRICKLKPRQPPSPSTNDTEQQISPRVVFALPPELILRVFQFLGPIDLCDSSLVSRTWNKLTKSSYLWYIQYQKAFTVSWDPEKFRDWRNTFITTYQKLKKFNDTLSKSNSSRAYLERYQEHLKCEHYHRALEDLNTVINMAKKAKRKRANDMIYQRALLYRTMNENKLAEADVRAIIKVQPTNEAMWRQLGNWAREDSNVELALEYYTKSLNILPTAWTHLCLSYLYFDQEDYAKALVYVNTAVEIAPEDAECFCLRGRIHHFAGRHAEALKDFDKAVSQATDCSIYYHFRGRVLREMDEMDKAMSDFEHAITITGDNIDLAYRGLIHWHKRNYVAALKDINAAIEIEPNYPSHYQSRGVMQYGMGKFVASYQDFTKAISISGENAGYYVWRAAITLERQQYSESMHDLDKAVRLKADHTSLFWRGLLHLLLGENAKARYDLQEANKVSQKKASRILFWLGVVLVVSDVADKDATSDENEEANQLWDQALIVAKTEPKIRPSRYAQAAHVAILRNDVTTAKHHFTEMLQSHCTYDNLRAECAHLRLLAKLFPESVCVKTVRKWFTKKSKRSYGYSVTNES